MFKVIIKLNFKSKFLSWYCKDIYKSCVRVVKKIKEMKKFENIHNLIKINYITVRILWIFI